MENIGLQVEVRVLANAESIARVHKTADAYSTTSNQRKDSLFNLRRGEAIVNVGVRRKSHRLLSCLCAKGHAKNRNGIRRFTGIKIPAYRKLSAAKTSWTDK